MNRLHPPQLAFATPRKLPKPSSLDGRVIVLDVAFASEASSGGFAKVTLPFIEGLGPRLVAWVDHHDHERHVDYADDPRFVLSTKAEHGACPEMVTPALVERTGTVDTVICHTDFDGLMSAAKWFRGGVEPYAGADDDARAVDTRMGAVSRTGERIDRALRARPRDAALYGLVVRHLVDGLVDRSLWQSVDDAASHLLPLEQAARKLAERYRLVETSAPAIGVAASAVASVHPASVAFVDATDARGTYDKTLLLLLGQERAPVSIVLDQDTLTLAARFDSQISFLALLGLSGGMPTLVSVGRDRLADVWARLGADASHLPV